MDYTTYLEIRRYVFVTDKIGLLGNGVFGCFFVFFCGFYFVVVFFISIS